MPQSEKQRLKLLYLLKILFEETDDNHGLTLKEITSMLNAYDISADRKTLYSDFETLRNFKIDIISEKEGRDIGLPLYVSLYVPSRAVVLTHVLSNPRIPRGRPML